MKNFIAIIITFCILVSIPMNAQVEKNNYSIAQAALRIDSLENSITSSDSYNNANTIFELSLLYRQIDFSQSKIYAYKYLKINDSISTVNNRSAIYGSLAFIYEKQNNADSAYYYLSLQANLINTLIEKNNKLLEVKYMRNSSIRNSNLDKHSQTYIILLFILLFFTISILIYYVIFKRQSNKIITAKNKELEAANTKFKEFNNSVNQGVINNTSKITIELEKSNNTIIELRKLLKKAEESNYLKNTFLGSMSHKIRTPLSGIMGFSDMLETELAIIGNEELFDYAKNIRESGAKLMSLITNIFDISNIEANILELKILDCDVNEIITSIEKDNLFKAKEKGIIYKTKLGAELPKIKADPNNLRKVLNIIVDNAIEYSSKSFVTISSKKNKNNTAEIRITDKGIGINNESLSMLIDSFDYKKHGSLLTYQNKGLGLILAHRLIDLMNGTLEITSKIDIGTEVIITMPCTIKLDSDTGVTSVTNQNMPKSQTSEFGLIKIFIVEDDRMNRLVLEKMLKKSGEIITAVDGLETFKIIEKSIKSDKLFDIMLFDISLPHPWDGIKLMHEVKKRFPAYKNVPFIAQTAYAMAYDKDTYLDAGFNDYIAKPISKTELITMIQKQLALFRLKVS